MSKIMSYVSSQLLKSKSDGEVGQSASCGAAAALPQSSSSHEKQTSNQV